MIARASVHPLERMVGRIAQAWEEKAAEFREHDVPGLATAYGRCAEQLREEAREFLEEALSPEDAAIEGRYTERHIRRLLQEKPELNVGTDSEPRIRRRAIPRKPGDESVAEPHVREILTHDQVAAAVAGGEH